MTNMYLNQTTGSYCYGKSKVSVSGDVDYSLCKLFKRYKHDITPPTTLNESICICKGSSTESAEDGETCQEPETCKNGGEKLILKVDSQYTSAKLERVDVYFNQYDLNNPLLFVLNFQSNGGSPENKYYKMSSFDNDKASGKEISGLPKYSEYNDIVQPLLDENDKLQDFLTFDIGKTSTSTTSGGASYHPYNNNKIHLTDDSGSVPRVSDTGFKRYKHEPLGNGDRKNGCVIYNSNVLMRKGQKPIDIQNQQYTAVNVYFGEKEKRTNGGALSVPLMVELNKNGSEPYYYVHKKGSINSKYYWEQLPGSQGEELKSLLEDIGLSTNTGGRGHETLKLLLNGASILNGGDLAEKLKNATGSKLKSLLDQKVNGSKSLLVVLLARVEFNLVDSVVILIDQRTDVSATGYIERVIGDAVQKLEPKREINRIKLGGKVIGVTNVTDSEGVCLQKYGYMLFKHDFSQVVKDLKPPGQEWAGLRFLIPAANSDKYKDLSLYNLGSTGPENLVYKYYNKSGSNGSKVYVVFYGDDPRPLMICYGDEAYIPNSKDEYDSEWVKAHFIKKCVCDDTSGNEALFYSLTRVVGFLNEVDLSKHPPGTPNGQCNTGSSGVASENTCPATNGNTCTYPVHMYNNNREIKVMVTCEPVNGSKTGNGTSCYRKLAHEPAGINGDDKGFRLGDVVYENESKGKLDYTNGFSQQNKYKPLVSVKAYFYNEDKHYNDPLLVVLEFKNGEGKSTNEKEYYKLKTTSGIGSTMTWLKDNEASGQTSPDKIVAYLDGIRYELKKVVQIKLDQNKSSPYDINVKPGKAGAGNNGFGPLQHGGKQIQVEECTDGTCPELAGKGYKCYKHKIKEALNDIHDQVAGVAFTIPSDQGEGSNPIEIKLYNGTAEGPATDCSKNQNGQQITPLTYNRCMGDIFVYFYGGDPRPLLLCFNKKAYRAQTKECYFKEWVQDSTIEKCDCSDGNGNVTKLLEALTGVVGFLNEVNLYNHPPGTGTGSNGCNAGSSDAGTANTCNTPAPEKNGTCTYEVHKYEGKPVRVRVTCSDVPPGSNGSCYRKLIHEQAGMNGKGAVPNNGFRLGNVVYNNGGSEPQGSINYYKDGDGNKSTHWRQPLLKVTAYFYDEDKCYEDPLLVVLEFANGSGTNDKECYKLKASGPSMAWEKDDQAGDKVEKNGKCLVEYLDEIRYGIKKVLQIKLEKNSKELYPLKGRAASAGTGFEPLQNGDSQQIQVAECEKTCEKLKESNYKCYQHQISTIGSGFDYNSIGGVAFTIPSDNGEDNVIQLYKNGSTVGTCTNGQTGEEIKPLTYNKCMGDIYVFFYNMGTSVDSVPLMLWYNHNYYKPCNRESYFTRWDKVPGLEGVTKPCGNDKPEELVKKLNEVNKELNRIELDNQKVSTARTGASSYGLPETVEVGSSKVNINTEVFKIERVSLTKQEGPKQPESAYTRIVHRTVNGYTIGKITYEKKVFATSGVSINGAQGGSEATIRVKKNGDKTNGNHKDLVAVKKWNTVVAYYSSNDREYKLPQLIVILKTDEVTGNTSVEGTGYGYYILTSNGSDVYEYKWVEVKNGSQVTLDDATDFRLLNSVVILLEQRPNNGGTDKYDEEQISSAIKSAQLTSPGQEVGEINRLKGKDKTIKVTDATTESEGKCLQKYGYKLFKHDFSNLVEIGDPLKGKLPGVNLIAGLRFLIPTSDSKEYKELRLYDRGKRVIYYKKEKNSIYVYFYGSDPRPLMLCYGGSAYRPMYMITYFYFREWVRDTEISNFVCKGTGNDCNNLLMALVEVSDFLNPVQIHQNNGKETTYEVHEFKGQKITIEVESKKATDTFCYNRYTHTHNGTGTDGKGFRLGTINYGCDCIQLKDNGGQNGNCITSQLVDTSPYTAASKVVVFYYQGDKTFKRPLLVALCKNDSESCDLYYELQNDGGSSGAKLYSKGKERSIDLYDFAKLGGILDNIRYKIAIKLQIIIDKIPMETLYCFKPGEKNGQPDICKKNNNICDKSDYIY